LNLNGSSMPPPRPAKYLFQPRSTNASVPLLGYVALLVGVMAFIIYGSYVPFEWQSRPWNDAVSAFKWAVSTRAIPDSRSDWAANVALGVPLGFAALGLCRANRIGRMADLLTAGAVVTVCTLFSGCVEFGQLFYVGRTCSGSDIWAQGFGAVIGATIWCLYGRQAAVYIRNAFSQEGARSSTAPLLAGYVGIILLVQLLPLDLTASPKEIYHRLTDSRKVTIVPFTDLMGRPGEDKLDDLKKLADWAELFMLFVPAGLLAAGLPGVFRSANGLAQVAGYGLMAAAATEAGQILVQSRHASTTDVLVGSVGILFGWATARILAERAVKLYRPEVALGLAQVWVAGLAVIHWQPFDFRPQLFSARLAEIDWMPLGSQVSKNYLWALNEILMKFLVFVPLGALAVWASKRHHERSRPILAAAACGLVALVLELGQSLVPSRYFSPTDILFGVIGGYIGGEITRRLMGYRVRYALDENGKAKKAAPSNPVELLVPPKIHLPQPAPDEPWWASAERAFPARPYPNERK
jgi:VanZ family protein